jgi:tRNA (guanine-N7-)-methyltransferase
MPSTMSSEAEHRHIRSFSGRRGHFTSGQRSAYESLLPTYGIGFSHQPIDGFAVFGRQAPLVLEIGFGMGETTAAIAQAQGHRNFIGVEVYPAGVGALLRRIEESAISNLRIIQHDAVDVLQHMIAPGSLSAVHVFFPDPWPKARHHKRRLIRPEIATLIAHRLEAGGVLHCATDWAHYALQMLSVLSSEPALENTAGAVHVSEDISEARGFAERPDYRPLTKFERRGLGLGHGVWDIVMRRRADR